MKRLVITLCILYLFLSSNAQNIYVAANGNDSNPGTKEKPVATLKVARDLVRQFMATNDLPKGGLSVLIGAGTYYQSEPFVLNENDSGEPGSPIVWKAMPNEKVSITGGKKIPLSEFKKVLDPSIIKRLSKNAAPHIMQVNLKALGIDDFGEIKQYGHGYAVCPSQLELFFDNNPMTLARYPNEGFIKIGEVLDPGSVPRTDDYSNRGGVFKYTDPKHEKWVDQKNIWFQGSFKAGFADDNLPVDFIDIDKKQVKLAKPSFYGVANGRDFQQYVAYNILEELDSPGEWFLDNESGLLYFWPPSDLTNNSIMVSILEDPIISLEGVSYLTISNVDVEVGRGIGIYMERGTNNLIVGCTVRNLGTSGIFMGQGAFQTFPETTHDNYTGVPKSRRVGSLQNHIYVHTAWDRKAGKNHGILSCDVYNTGSGGIALSGGNKRKLINGNNYIENCKVHDYNRRNKFLFAGINVDGCGNRVSHCEVYNSDWQGIYVNGNEHLFEYNNIHHVTLNSDDTSPWYIGRDPSDRGNIVRYNYFHHCGNPNRMNMGIYCDDSSTDVEIFGNIFYKMNTNHGVLFTNSGWDLKFKNNIVIEPINYVAKISAHYYTWYKNGAVNTFGEDGLFRERLLKSVNIMKPPYSEKYPELLSYLKPIDGINEWEGMRSRRNIVSENLIIGGAKKPLNLDGGEHAKCEYVNNHRMEKDPGFVDYKNENFNLKSNSIVFKKIDGFQKIPFSKMGLYVDQYRKLIEKMF